MTDKGENIVVPKNRKHEKQLKSGFVDSDNTDIAYFNFGLLWPNIISYTFVVVTVAVAVYYSLKSDVLPTADQIKAGYSKPYGRSAIFCSRNATLPANPLPSLINLFETNVSGNVLFRLAVCYPMVVRLFNSLVFRMKASQQNSSLIHDVINNFIPIITLFEVFSLALFAVITTHSDFESTNVFFKRVFAASSAANMAMSTAVFFAHSRKSDSKIDVVSLIIKALCTVAYCYIVPQVSLDTFRDPHVCHSYLPSLSAIKEYSAIAIYAIFHLTTIADVRNLAFVCYPRTCSGECEPVVPDNFAKGGKYEHCRSWEYNQQQEHNM